MFPVRIAFFTSRMLLGYGVDLVVAELAQRLARDGNEVVVFATAMDATYAGRGFELRRLETTRAECEDESMAAGRNSGMALSRLRPAPVLAEFAGDDIAIPCTFPFYGVHRYFPGAVIHFDFGNVPTAGLSPKGKLNWFYRHLLEAGINARGDSVLVTLSRFLASRFLPETQRRVRVVHPGGDHYFNAMKQSGGEQEDLRMRLRESLGVGGHEVVIACCSRLHRRNAAYKNLPELVGMFREMRAAGAPVRLLLAGLGTAEDAAWLEAQGADVLPNAPSGIMPSFYCAADIYASPSLWEGFNLPLVEAAWFGVPSVAYAIGAHRETTASMLASDRQQFFAALKMLVSSQNARAEMGEASRLKAGKFSWKDAFSSFRKVIGEVTSQR
jgi:glycosyltransferase involved in cell wall biosynthesis